MAAMQPTTRNEFLATKQCGLCRGLFPWNSSCNWESSFRAVLYIGDTETIDESEIVLTDCARLPDTSQALCLQEITIFRDLGYRGQYSVEQTAYCMHNLCYLALVTELGGCSRILLYKLLKALTPEPSLYDIISWPRYAFDFPKLATDVETKLQPYLMSHLPVELKAQIWSYVGPTAQYSACLLAANESGRLAHSLRPPDSREIVLRKGLWLSIQTIPIFGVDYIQELRLYDNEGKIFVMEDVYSIAFAVGLRGICAIKLIGDTWKSDWIGKIPSHQYILGYGSIASRSSSFYIHFNGLCFGFISDLAQAPSNQVLWDRPNIPFSMKDPDAILIDYHRDLKLGYRMQHTTQQIFRYLSLWSEGEYISGLTVYATGFGMCGLEAHFSNTSQLSGVRQGCALHCPFLPEERIAHIWIRFNDCVQSACIQPGLLVQTTLNKLYSFGPFVDPGRVSKENYKWVLLENKGYVVGFYYQSPEISKTISRVGIESDESQVKRPRISPKYYNCEWPDIASPSVGLFLSVAILSDLEKVEVCRANKRCIGILLYYLEGSPVVLGQWRTNLPTSCIYQHSFGHATSLCFRTAKLYSREIVTDIYFREEIEESQPFEEKDVQEFEMGQQIAWWFSGLYDSITLWEGQSLDIPHGNESSWSNGTFKLTL